MGEGWPTTAPRAVRRRRQGLLQRRRVVVASRIDLLSRTWRARRGQGSAQGAHEEGPEGSASARLPEVRQACYPAISHSQKELMGPGRPGRRHMRAQQAEHAKKIQSLSCRC